MSLGQINPRDRRFWPDKPDADFSPEYNKRVVENTIKKYEKKRVEQMRKFKDALRERTNAVASYLTGLYGAHRNRTIEKYFGKRYLAKLRGEDIVNKIKRLKMNGTQS